MKEEKALRKLLIELGKNIYRMTGRGAIVNAHLEVLRAETSVEDIEAQLRHVRVPASRRAA